MIIAILLAMAGVAPQTAPPVPPMSATPVDAERRGKALRLSQLLNPESSIIDESGDDYVKSSTQVLTARGKLNELETRYPGIIEAMMRASVPTMNAQMQLRVPILWNRLADIYLAAFTGVELDQMLAFYGSPTGRKMLASINNRMKPKAMLSEMAKNEDFSISVGSFRSDLKDAVPGVVSDLGPQDKLTLLAFMQTSAFKKIAANSGRIQELTLAWAQEETPDEERELETVMRKAMNAYMKKKDAETGLTT